MAAMGFFNHDEVMSGRSNDRAPYRVELRRISDVTDSHHEVPG